MLYEAWWQTFQTGCAPAALVAAWPSSALHSESSTLYWHTCGEGGWGVRLVWVIMCVFIDSFSPDSDACYKAED